MATIRAGHDLQFTCSDDNCVVLHMLWQPAYEYDITSGMVGKGKMRRPL